MKKITKTFYVSEFMFKGVINDNCKAVKDEIRVNSGNGYSIPIEITFSVPEKRVSLSESEFENLSYQCGDDMKRAKKKLFGESND